MVVLVRVEVWCSPVNVMLQFGKWLLKDEVSLEKMTAKM